MGDREGAGENGMGWSTQPRAAQRALPNYNA